MGKAVKWMLFTMMIGNLTILAEEKENVSTATLNIHFSNDIIGYLTPCG
jgi:hypothetical protein